MEDLSDLSGGILGEFGFQSWKANRSRIRTKMKTDRMQRICSQFIFTNSKLTFNGSNIERNSNSITDVVAGVTLNLKSVMAIDENEVTVDTANDVSSVKTKLMSL
ncbi:MAG: flagellar filament capping protein FliD [Ignavibacteriales bacterium]|nr:flagellar filament capping protein FliD [Ignavibacteriales bacterium]